MSIEVEQRKFDINLKFYFFLKMLVKIGFTDTQIAKILQICHGGNAIGLYEKLEALKCVFALQTIKGRRQEQFFGQVVCEIVDEFDFKLFIFSLKLFSIKGYLLALAKLKILSNAEKLSALCPLSLEYDKITLYNPYATRVNGALLSLIFFEGLDNGVNIIPQAVDNSYIANMAQLAQELRFEGVESNQIFMLMFNESINQSIISDSGSDYEERILGVLERIGISRDGICKKHDENDGSTEFDFYFSLDDGRTYGIGAKRTLRERYKQFIKTSYMSKLDVMIEITLGTDLTEEKVRQIRAHGVYLFVAEEIYENHKNLCVDGVFSSKDLTIDTLKKLR